MSEIDNFLSGIGDMLTKEQREELIELSRNMWGDPVNDAIARLTGRAVRFVLINNGLKSPETG